MIAVGFLVSYDFELLKIAIPLVYEPADVIVLGIDKNRTSFTGKPFSYDENFKLWVKDLDIEKKVRWVEDEFYQASLSPMQNETRERNKLFESIAANWYIQLDADEYFIDFPGFIRFLKANEQGNPPLAKLSISVNWKTVYKSSVDGFFLIGGKMEQMSIATNIPIYDSGRTQYEANVIHSPSILIHQSWGRSEGEVMLKLTNWSHAHDFDADAFYKKWFNCNKENYRKYKNFHPLYPVLWENLELRQEANIKDLVRHYQLYPPVSPLPSAASGLRNLLSRAKKIIRRKF